MHAALALAKHAFERGEVPVGCMITDATGAVIAESHNEVEAASNPTRHAELIAIERAFAATGQKYLEGCTLIVTLEPCAMCAGAIAHARLSKLIFGAYDAKSGGVEHGARVLAHSHHQPEIIAGVMESDCATLLKEFFSLKRSAGK
jgi:tRNA(adenine34) deaminase